MCCTDNIFDDSIHRHSRCSPGEELFISYSTGDDWLQQRGIFIIEAVENDSHVPPIRPTEELQRIGICMTDVEVSIHKRYINGILINPESVGVLSLSSLYPNNDDSML